MRVRPKERKKERERDRGFYHRSNRDLMFVRAITIVNFSSTLVFECVSCIKKTDFLDIAL